MKCPLCFKSKKGFWKKNDYECEKEINSNDIFFQCKSCYLIFNKSKLLERRYRKKKKLQGLICPVCYERNWSDNEKKGDSYIKCKNCDSIVDRRLI